MSLNKLFQILKGGPGSGNFGHAGRPGQRGGSTQKGSAELIFDTELQVNVLKNPIEYFNSKLKSGEVLTGRAFNKIPDLDNLGTYRLSQIAKDSKEDDFADFVSLESVEWGYGPFGIVMAAPKTDIFMTDTKDYPLERALKVDNVRILAAVVDINNMNIDASDVKSFETSLKNSGYDIPIFGLESKLEATGYTTSLRKS